MVLRLGPLLGVLGASVSRKIQRLLALGHSKSYTSRDPGMSRNCAMVIAVAHDVGFDFPAGAS